MNKFRLIAIIPLKDCDRKFRKNLEIGFPYKFYKEFDIHLNDDQSEVNYVVKNPSLKVPQTLYSLKNGINVNVSAVVGKNGTGKSSVVELLYYIIYVLGVKKGIINSVKDDLVKDLKKNEKYYEFFENTNEIENEKKKIDIDLHILDLIQKYEIKIPTNKIKKREHIYNHVKNSLFAKIVSVYSIIKEEQENESIFKKGLNATLIYEFEEDIIIGLKIYKGDITLTKYVSGTPFENISLDKFDLVDFFYTISLNYSHHGLNSNVLGNWITKLFHKNDAYTTPVVINPMRDGGNFNINHEMKLSKERLATNVVYDLVNGKENLILSKYKVSKFIFSPKTSSPFNLEYGDNKFIDKLESAFVFKEILGINELDEYITYWDFAIGYLEKKIKRIEENYYDLIHSTNNSSDRNKDLRLFIATDQTHITKKIRQVVNFLKITKDKNNRHLWIMPDNNIRAEMTPNQLLDWINLFSIDIETCKPTDLIEYALPGFFNIDFELEDSNGQKFEFGTLSSGEQQMIFNINSILYHLNNIQSVHNISSESYFGKDGRIERVKYKNVNLILDEIELYYHPEIQRQLVKNIIDSFENIKHKGENGISSINICFLTHSPFILSDIPAQNILMLLSEDDKKSGNISEEQTFGANIHDLLTNNFFMESTTGEYSLSKMSEIVNFFYKVREKEESGNLNLLIEEYNNKRDEFDFVSKNIGEKFMGEILENHILYIKDVLDN